MFLLAISFRMTITEAGSLAVIRGREHSFWLDKEACMNTWVAAGAVCLGLGIAGLRKSSRRHFPNYLVPAGLIGLAPVCWALALDIKRANGSYPISLGAGLVWLVVIATAWIAQNHPAGRDHAILRPGHPRAWRWYAAAWIVLFAVGVVSIALHVREKTAYEWLELLVSFVVLIGIYSYAFQRQLLPRIFWRIVAPAYCLWAGVGLVTHWPGMMAGFHKAQGTTSFVIALVFGLPIIIGMPVLNSLALLRLSWLPPISDARLAAD